MVLTLLWIPGVMFGIEFDYINKHLVLDFGIIRAVFSYGVYRDE
jgi:hypothetical protein